jgi:hypothetical protein
MDAPAPADPLAPFEDGLRAKGYRPAGWKDVLDTCHFTDRKTGQEVKLDRARLDRIAEFRNRMAVGRQSVAHFCLGHTKDDAPEWEQPPVVGLATRWRVGSYADGTPNLEAYAWEKPGQAGVFEQYPQRSAELWLDPDDVNPVALLGATTPRRNLSHRLSAFGDAVATGTGRSAVRFWRHDDPGRHPILFEMRADMDNPVKCDGGDTPAADPTVTPDEKGEQFGQAASVKELSAKVDKIAALLDKYAPVFDLIAQEVEADAAGPAGPDGAAAPPPGGPGGPPAPPPGPAGGPPPAPAPAAGPDSPPVPDREDGPHKKNTAGSPAGYRNTAMPSYAFQADPEAVVRLQRENEALTRRLADTEKQTAALKLQRMEDETNALLDRLEAKVAIDRAYDFDRLVRLSREDRTREAEKMLALRAAKAPPAPGGGEPVVNPQDVAQPVRFSRPATGVAGDPAVLGSPAPDDYDSLVRAAGDARRSGESLRELFDVSRLTPAHAANGVQVR